MDSLRTGAQRASNRATDRDLTADQLAALKELSKRGSVNAAADSNASASVSTPAPVPAPAAPVTPISRPTHHHRPLPAPQTSPATPTTSTPAQTLPDSRDDVPETCKESYILGDALEETVVHFRRLTGQTPKPTKSAESYSSQWNALQAQFAPIWKSQRPAEETPLLFRLGAWTGGIDRWDDSEMQLGDEKRDREGEIFLKYMEDTAEGTAYVGPDGTWRSVRDTWCNSHSNPTVGHWGRISSSSDEDSEKDSGEQPREGSREGSGEGSEDDSEEAPDEGSDNNFGDAE